MKIIQSLILILSFNSFVYGQTLLIPNGESPGSSSATGRVEINGSNGITNGKQFRVVFGGGGNLLNTEFQALTHLPEILSGNAWTALYANKGNAQKAAVFNGDVSFFNGNIGFGSEKPDKLLTLQANKVLGWEYGNSGSGSHHTITGGGINPMSFTVNPFSANTPIFKFNGHKGTNLTILNGGNVGIGTEKPDRSLTLQANKILGWEYGNSGSGSHHTISGGGINPMSFTVNPFSSNTPIFKFNGNKGTNLTILNGGNIGIGTENPNSTLEVLGSDGGINGRNFKVTYAGGGGLENTEFSALTHITHIPNVNGWTALYANQGNAKRAGVFNGDVSVNGLIHTKEVKVDLVGWSDFVFYDDYKLPTLTEVENHIKEKGHLKDIPSAKEVVENGVLLGEMDSKLLQKIEELTLYTIQQEKKIKEQANDIQKLKNLNEKFLELQSRLDKLEKK